MNYRKRVRIWISVVKSFVITFAGVGGNILNAEETVKEILKGKSLIRFGDGEFGIYRGKDIHYQKWSPELRDAFEKIKAEYEFDHDNCPYLLSVPKKFMEANGLWLMQKRVYVSSWSESRADFKHNFRHDIPYGDAFLFEKKNKSIYSEIWKWADKSVIFVHNSEKYADAFAATYGPKVRFVQVPPKDAYQKLNNLEDTLWYVIQEINQPIERIQIVISAGPAGKVLAYKFSKLGYQCIDAGHCWDDPLES